MTSKNIYIYSNCNQVRSIARCSDPGTILLDNNPRNILR